jgi:regulator of sigma E protease
MLLTIIIAFASLIGLVVLHELSHFAVAKKFGVKVEEFGIGYPPRIFGKRMGETVYSFNLLPFGAFVKMLGEEGAVENERSFSKKPIWQRSAIVLAGVASFWVIAAIILSFVFVLGAPTVIPDNEAGRLRDIKVQIAAVLADTPAEKAGIQIGDTVKQAGINDEKITVDNVKEVQDFIDSHKGQEITLTLQRGQEIVNVSLVPRQNPPQGQGAIGVALARTAIKSYPWWQAIWQGMTGTYNLTLLTLQGWGMALSRVISGVSPGIQLMGPVGIISLFNQAGQLGVNYFLQFIAIISVNVALLNLLPIPAFDGGRFLFLMIEAVKRKPLSPRIEQSITAVSFVLLVILMIWVTIKDVSRLF